MYQTLDAIVNFLTRPEILFPVSVILLVASLKFAHVWTRPPVALGLLGVVLVFGVYSYFDWPFSIHEKNSPGVAVSHWQFRASLGKADNLPIVIVMGLIGFFYWFTLRRAVLNDERIAGGMPPVEADEKSRKVLVWPDLVYTELIAMVVCTLIVIVWSVLIQAPIEESANTSRTPNPSKAPWYFLGLQELLVYFDPWLAGVVVPGLIIMGLIIIPYVDRNPKGNGYFTLKERPGAIFVFLFGFFVLWILGVFIGTFLRGPGWNFFGLYENWDVNKVEPLLNVNVSEIVWTKIIGVALPDNAIKREIWGLLIVIIYMTAIPALIARTVGKKMFRELGAIRFGIVANLGLIMMAVPLKMVARWLFNLKYVVYLPDIQLNI